MFSEEAFGRQRADFRAMQRRTLEYTRTKYLPRSLKKVEEGTGGILTLVDATEKTLCVPGDPRNMEGQTIEAWYNMFVDDSIPENRRFPWVTGLPGAASAATKESRKKAKTSRKAKGTTPSTSSYPTLARRPAGDDVSSSEDENPPRYAGESETSAGEGPSEPRLRAPTISKRGRISSAPQILAPLNSSRKRPTAYVHVDATPIDSNETANDPERRTSDPPATNIPEPRSAVRSLPEVERPPQTATGTTRGTLTSPQKVTSAPAAATDLPSSFKFRPPNDDYPTHLSVSCKYQSPCAMLISVAAPNLRKSHFR